MPRPDPRSFLPLRPLELLVLSVLAPGPLHGYAIRGAILDHSDGAVPVEPGNLYRHIRRLLAERLIEDDRGHRAAGDDDRRRYFRLTLLGGDVLNAELRRIEALARHVRSSRPVATRPVSARPRRSES